MLIRGFPGGQVVKNPPANVGDKSSISEWGRSPRVGNGHTLRYFCLGNPRDRRAWWTTVQEVAKSQTELSMHTHYSNIHIQNLY